MESILFLIALDDYEHYTQIQKKLFENGYCWKGTSSQALKQSQLNKATHVLYNTNTKEITRFLTTQNTAYILDNFDMKNYKNLSSTSFLTLPM